MFLSPSMCIYHDFVRMQALIPQLSIYVLNYVTSSTFIHKLFPVYNGAELAMHVMMIMLCLFISYILMNVTYISVPWETVVISSWHHYHFHMEEHERKLCTYVCYVLIYVYAIYYAITKNLLFSTKMKNTTSAFLFLSYQVLSVWIKLQIH